MSLKELDKMRKVLLGGALAVKSTDIIGHARNPTALTGDIGSFVGIGITGATSNVAMKMITGKKKCHICNKRKTMKSWSICAKCKKYYGKKKYGKYYGKRR